MANTYEVNVVNPRRKAKRKATKRRTAKKKAGKRKAKKKAGKKKISKVARSRAAKKAAKTRAKKKAARSRAAKKAAKTRARGGKKKATKSKARRPKKNPAYKWTRKAEDKWYYYKGARAVAGPFTSSEMDRVRASAQKKGISVAAAAIAAKAKKPQRRRGIPTQAARPRAPAATELKRAAKEMSEEVSEVQGAWHTLKAKLKRAGVMVGEYKKEIATLESSLRSCKTRLGRAKKRGDLTASEEARLQDQLDSCRAQLKIARAVKATKRKATKRKATKRKATKRKATKRPSHRRAIAPRAPAPPPWPANVPRPGFAGIPEVMTVERAVDRLSSAAKGMRRGASASARRMQLASKGYLQLNPLEDIPGYPGVVAQFKTPQSRRARAVAADVPRSVRPRGPKRNKQMSAREKQAILRRVTRGT